MRHGQQSLGLRSITFDVGSLGELYDRIESVLRTHTLFTSRQDIAQAARLKCSSDGTPTICRLSSSATPRANPQERPTTERCSIWSIHSTHDATPRWQDRSTGNTQLTGITRVKTRVR